MNPTIDVRENAGRRAHGRPIATWAVGGMLGLVLAACGGNHPDPGAPRSAPGCDDAAVLLRTSEDPRLLERALRASWTTCPANAPLVTALWHRVPADSAALEMLLRVGDRIAGQALFDTLSSTMRDPDRARAVRLYAMRGLARYVSPHRRFPALDRPRWIAGVPVYSLGSVDHPGFDERAPVDLSAPDTVLAALRAIAGTDPDSMMRHAARHVHRVLSAEMEDPRWQAKREARRNRLAERAAGCWRLEMGPWPEKRLPAYRRSFHVPRIIELDTAGDPNEFLSTARMLRPRTSGSRGTWWVVGPDTVTLRWSGETGGLILVVALRADRLEGRARAYGERADVEMRTSAAGLRVPCASTGEEPTPSARSPARPSDVDQPRARTPRRSASAPRTPETSVEIRRNSESGGP